MSKKETESDRNVDATDASRGPEKSTTRQHEKDRRAGSASSPEESDTQIDIGTADDINVDADNASESPTKSLTSAEPDHPAHKQ